jgi:tetratricopeptide (TPR) repeat protein
MRLKRKNPHSTASQASAPATTVPLSAGGAAAARRLWFIRLATMILVPLLLLGTLELALRLAGYGYPTSFFIRTRIDGRDFYVTNYKFGFRFFPPELSRAPEPLRMAADKPSHAYRIFLFGESAAYGDPDPSYGVGRYLEVLLRERFPGTQFEVVCAAMTAINSHAILPIARECAQHQGDLWILYMGNNEIVGPFGGGTILGPQAPGRGLVRANLAVKSTKIGQLIDAISRRLRRNSSMPQSWGGMKMFMGQRVRYDDPRRLKAYRNFKENLEDILAIGHKAGVPIVLSTMAVNLKDCAPFASMPAKTLGEDRKGEWERLYQQGVGFESTGAFQRALEAYSKAADIDDQFADLQFRMGSCQLALTNFPSARQSFELARDYDALVFRADKRVNEIIRSAAARYETKGVYLVDAMSAVAGNSTGRIPGDEDFYEHVHLNFDGNYLLARMFAEQIAKVLPEPIRKQDRGEWASAELCDRCLAVTVWDRFRIWQVIHLRIQQPPYIEQSNHSTRVKKHEAELEDIRSRSKTQTPVQAAELYKQALALAPEDNLLHANYAQFLDAGGQLVQAIEEARRVRDLVPQMPGPSYYIGTLLVRAGKTDEALDCFSRAIALQNNFVEAMNGLGLILANQQKPAEAARWFTRALRADPTRAETYLNLGFMEQGQGKLDEAMAHYQEAARLQPRGPADFFGQAVALAAQGRHSEAIQSFRILLPYEPGFWQAHYLLGVELATQGQYADAGTQYSETIRLRPDYAPAHLNLGISLAKQGKKDQALVEFRKTLQLDPTNALARQYLATF